MDILPLIVNSTGLKLHDLKQSVGTKQC